MNRFLLPYYEHLRCRHGAQGSLAARAIASTVQETVKWRRRGRFRRDRVSSPVREHEKGSELPNGMHHYMTIYFNFLDFFTVINHHFYTGDIWSDYRCAVEGVGTGTIRLRDSVKHTLLSLFHCISTCLTVLF
jgi:hypothetical protein